RLRLWPGSITLPFLLSITWVRLTARARDSACLALLLTMPGPKTLSISAARVPVIYEWRSRASPPQAAHSGSLTCTTRRASQKSCRGDKKRPHLTMTQGRDHGPDRKSVV